MRAEVLALGQDRAWESGTTESTAHTEGKDVVGMPVTSHDSGVQPHHHERPFFYPFQTPKPHQNRFFRHPVVPTSGR